MNKPNLKEYIFSNTVTVVEETTVQAKTYEDAVDLFLSGKGETDEVDSFGSDWECIDNPDDFEENEDET
tara:strand:- start:221 stop:427 length:207 start_codon:yes stop_codon:yes gene_type:complete